MDGEVAWALAGAAPVALAAAWGAFVSPKARVTQPRPARLAVELGVWSAAAAALAATGRPWLALGFLAVAVASGTLNEAWREPEAATLGRSRRRSSAGRALHS